MKCGFIRFTLGALFACGLSASLVSAQEAARTLPTLLIKGEVVSLDNADPAAVLLKVKDRYGFETPIYLSGSTKVTQGDAAVDASSLTTGTAVEVEYNFDVNTAKRHAVSVKAIGAASATTPAMSEAIPPASVDSVMVEPMTSEEIPTEEPIEPVPSEMPSEQQTAP
ncbi:MAG: hypothetical protein HYT88_02715 [Candidatus Omnitrophica bacterium]|nr:hypothetical protein [Candidatus Omnitrophota bacterium]